jgi:hypothetical protein
LKGEYVTQEQFQMLQILLPIMTPVATMVIVLVGILYNNGRIADVSNRINDMRDLLRAEMAKNQSELLMKFAELDRRISSLEGKHS